jgi:hypothetical protein
MKIKRAGSAGPVNIYVEVAVVTDFSVYLAHQTYAQSTDQAVVFTEMRVYYAHLIYAVSEFLKH